MDRIFRYRRLIAPVAVAAVWSFTAGCRQAPAWGGHLDRGPLPVGVLTQDLEREAPDGSRRQLHLVVWYPAADAGRGRSQRLGDLLAMIRAEHQFPEIDGVRDEAALAQVLTGDSAALSPERARAALAMPGWAVPSAAPRPGPFPLVLWSSRHATVLAQAPMAEVLASHGYTVATVWSSDPPLAFIWEDVSAEAKQATIEAQTDDLAFAIGALGGHAWVDTSRIVVAAWSYGGQTAARLQARVDAVRGIVGFDANVLPARPEEELALRRPGLMMMGSDTARRGLERADSITAPVVLVRLPDLRHGAFNAMEGFLPAIFETDSVFPWSQRGVLARDGYRALVSLSVGITATLMAGPAATTRTMTASVASVGLPETIRIEVRTISGDAARSIAPAPPPPPARPAR